MTIHCSQSIHPQPGAAARLLLAVAAMLLAASPVSAVTHLHHGDTAPAIALQTIDGAPASLAQMHGRPVVVVFGELYHQRTLDACRQIMEAIEGDALGGREVALMLVVAQDAPVEELRERARDAHLSMTILHDVDRAAYSTYRVAVMPSTVVIDGKGKVVHAMAGYSARLPDIVTDALRVATGTMRYEQFELLLNPQEAEGDEQRVRAARLTKLAQQLARRQLGAMSEEKFREAIDLDPDYAPARLGLAMRRLHTRRLADAEQEFHAALEIDTASIEASLGLAYVKTLRGGDELDDAETILRKLLQSDPDEPRALYLLGLVHDQRGEAEQAIKALRRSAEVLMSRREGWNVVPGMEETRDLDEPTAP